MPDEKFVPEEKGSENRRLQAKSEPDDLRTLRVNTLSRSLEKSGFLFPRGHLVACYWYKLSVYGRSRAFTKPKPALVLNHNIDGTYSVELEKERMLIDDAPARSAYFTRSSNSYR